MYKAVGTVRAECLRALRCAYPVKTAFIECGIGALIGAWVQEQE